jgi:hypothetical protein
MKKERKKVKNNENGKWVSPLFSMITSSIRRISFYL